MKKTHFNIPAIFFILCCAFATELSTAPESPDQQPLNLDMDLATFMGNAGLVRVEIYQSIGRGGLSYEKDSSFSAAQFSVETIIQKEDSAIFTDKVSESDRVADKAEIKSGQQFVYTVPVFLPPGEYEFLTRIHDLVSDRSQEKALTLNVKDFSSDSLTFSDIQFATRIERAKDKNSMHQKNNLLVTPNPKAQFGEGNTKLTFYSELYNLGDADNGAGTYRVDYIITNEDGELLHKIKGKERKKAGRHAAIFTSFDIADLTSSIYRLRLVAHDDQTGLESKTEKEFSVIWEKDIAATSPEQQANPYLTLDDKQLDLYFAKIHYIATNEERTLFSQLMQSGKQSFLVAFWQNRDPTPDTQKNEFKDEYIERLVQVNTHFVAGHLEGWRTDRGRIFLTYGPPNFIEREPENNDKRAFETWQYTELDGGSIFVFVDIKSNGLFELIHSTYRKEISYSDWESYMLK
jgi:GWxTD domain-containing protein